MSSVKELANLSNVVYDGVGYNGWEISQFERYTIEIPAFNWSKMEFYDDGVMKEYGFKAAIYKKGNEAVIAFSGSDDPLDFYCDLFVIAGYAPSQLDEADEYYKFHIDSLVNANITVTGHSLGGYLAEFIGNMYAHKTITFNSPGLKGDFRTIKFADGTKSRVEVTKKYGSEDLISHYLCRGDPVSMLANKKHMGKVHWMQPPLPPSNPRLDRLFNASTEELLEMQSSGELESDDYGSGAREVLERALTETHSIRRWTEDDSLYDENGDLKPDKEVWIDK